MKKKFLLASLMSVLIAAAGCTTTSKGTAPSSASKRDGVKYVFLLIGDGYGSNQRYVTEALTGTKLAMSRMEKTLFTGTNNKDDKTTDSAASGTAIACGIKTGNGMLGVDGKGKPVESLAMKLQKRGFKIGMISSSPLNDATPGAHYAHQPSRNMFKEIVQDMAKSDFAFFGGAGFKGEKDKLIPILKKRGYKYIEGPDALAMAKPGEKTFVDCNPFTQWNPGDKSASPSLADYLTKAIEVLDNPNGFFIMLENGMTDAAGHNNDAGKLYREVLALDEAVKVALAFQEKHPTETLVIVTADHETGGFQAENPQANQLKILTAQKGPKNELIDLLKPMIKTNEPGWANKMTKAVEAYLGTTFTPEEIAELDKVFAKQDIKSAVKDAFNMRDARAGIKYTTGGHSSAKIITNVKGPGADKFAEPLENSDIPHIIGTIVIPDYNAAAYWKGREIRVAFFKSIEPFEAMPDVKADVAKAIPLPIESRTTMVNGKTFKLELPDWSRVVESTVKAKDGTFYVKMSNHDKLASLRYGLWLKADPKAVFYVYDLLSKSIYVHQKGETWTSAQLEKEFSAPCPAGATTYLLISQKPLPDFARAKEAVPGRVSVLADATGKQRAQPAAPTFKIKSADEAPIIDGVLNDEVWKDAVAYDLKDPSGNAVKNPPIVKARTDKKHSMLYLGIRIPDSNILTNAVKRDDLAVFNDDTMEIFIGAQSEETYYQIAVTARKAIYDEKSGDAKWNSKMEMEVKTEKGCWILEAAIPMAQFGFSSPIQGNLCRNNKPENKLSNLSPTGGSFHNKSAFMVFEFTD